MLIRYKDIVVRELDRSEQHFYERRIEMFRTMGFFFLMATASSILAADDAAKDNSPIRKVAVKVDLPDLGKLSASRGITTFHSSEEAEKSLGEGIAKQIAGQIDFAKEDLVLVAWAKVGPPFATLAYEIKDEKDGKVIRFHLQQPKPSRLHGNVAMRVTDFFAVPKGAKVEFGRPTPRKANDEKTDETTAHEFRGTLRTGIMAIGGETTGTIISVKGGKTYELEFRTNPKLRDLVEKLNKKEAVVKGTLRVKQGIEISERRIIDVTELQPADAQHDDVTKEGTSSPERPIVKLEKIDADKAKDLLNAQAVKQEKEATVKETILDIITKKPSDKVKMTIEKDTATLDVSSQSGIGGATVTLAKGKWPTTVVLRLHLSGLKSFAVSNGKIKLTGSVLSHSGNTKRLYLTEFGKEGEREPGTEIKNLVAAGKPVKGLPDKGGYFEITLPNALLEGESKSLELGWIDFYRG